MIMWPLEMPSSISAVAIVCERPMMKTVVWYCVVVVRVVELVFGLKVFGEDVDGSRVG